MKRSFSERGGAAIEFAILFPFMLVVFYSIVSFGIYIMLNSSLQQLSAEISRGAVQVNTGIMVPVESQQQRMEWHLSKIIESSWLERFELRGCVENELFYHFDTINPSITTCLQIDYPLPDLVIFGFRLPGVGSTLQAQSFIRL